MFSIDFDVVSQNFKVSSGCVYECKEGTSPKGGPGACSPGKFKKNGSAEMQFEGFWAH